MTPSERVIAALEARGLNVRGNGGRKWEAQCPSHDDRNASLSMDVGDDERALLHCHAGCSTEEIVAALGLELRDLFADNRASNNGHRKIVATYDYVAENGELLYQVIRFEPKSFRQRRPDDNGGWQWNLKGTRRVLYRLPQVLEAVATGCRVWVVEGEKDVHALEEIGEVATCNAGGAGKWRAEAAETLRGASLVLVIADRDEPGRKHAQAVAASLEGIAAQVRVGEPAEGKDVHDHLAAGLGVRDFTPVSLPAPGSTQPTDATPDASELPPVSTADLVAEIGEFMRRFVILPSRAGYLAVSLFAMHTWAFDAAHATPYLVIESPEKQSGKSRLLEVLELVAHNPLKAASITAAALFQSVNGHRPTLLIDEADAIFGGNSERNEDLRGVLNAGNVPGSPVIRGGKDGNPVRYDVFCPKTIAGIATGKLPDTVRDRSIVIPIDRKLRSESVERLRRHRLEDEVDSLRSRLSIWAQQNHEALFRYDLPEPLEKISDRLEEAWEPLMAIADLAGGEYPEHARAAAVSLAGDDDEDATASHTLLIALRAVFGDAEKMFSKDIVTELSENEELPFGAWNDGNGIKQAELARLLKRYRVRPRTVKIDKATAKGYQREQFLGAWDRYGADSAVTPVTSQQTRAISGFDEPSPNPQGDGSRNAENPRPIREVTAVTAESGPDATMALERSGTESAERTEVFGRRSATVRCPTEHETPMAAGDLGDCSDCSVDSEPDGETPPNGAVECGEAEQSPEGMGAATNGGAATDDDDFIKQVLARHAGGGS